MNISLAIMAHPKRTREAQQLYRKLKDQPFFTVAIIWDEQNNEWKTGKRALKANWRMGEAGPEASDWHIVLQDDAIIPDNFYEHVVNAIRAVPEKTLISLYTGTVRPFRSRVTRAVAMADKASWLRSYLLYWGVGIVIPTMHIDPVLEFVADRTEPYDYRIGMFYQANIMPVFYTNPSLVDHNDELKSLVGNGRTKNPDEDPRVAHNFIDGPVQWNSEFVDI